MNTKTFVLLMAAALIAAFFLEFRKEGGSGLDIVKAANGNWKMYFFAVPALCGVMLLIGALQNGRYPISYGLWTWLPLLAVLMVLFILPAIDGVEVKNLFKGFGKSFGIGLWITIVASLLLAFYRPRR